jgi:hypothetical protein
MFGTYNPKIGWRPTGGALDEQNSHATIKSWPLFLKGF